MSFADIIGGYQTILHYIAEIAIYSLELIGICVILIGSFKAIFQVIANFIKKKNTNIIISLGKALALALEFKMGAEIVKTVIVHNLEELGILAIVIILRALLALLIHWEIKAEKKDEEAEAKKESEEK